MIVAVAHRQFLQRDPTLPPPTRSRPMAYLSMLSHNLTSAPLKAMA